MSRRRIAAIIAVLAVVVVLVVWLTEPRSRTTRSSGKGTAVRPKQNHFSLAMHQLARLDQFDPVKGMTRTAYHLNLWLAAGGQDVPWQPDPLIARLPANLRAIPPLQTLAKPQFTADQVRYLRQASWARSVSQWVANESRPLEIEDWLDEVQKNKGEAHAYEVSTAARLCDWTIRNVQLDKLLPYPEKSAVTGAGASAFNTPLQTATPGPGYTAYPWQTMLFGHGDAWLRARVFILLCRQQQIDVVMLAFDEAGTLPRPRPWIPAALIDDQLYLFDPGLGILIPGPGGTGIATLEQVLGDKQILRSLSVGSSYPYKPADADMSKLVAMVDASAEALSYRMKAVEDAASTREPLLLSVAPSEMARRLKKCAGITDVRLWAAPFETWIYRTAMVRRAKTDFNIERQLMFENWGSDNQNPMVKGRVQYFRGNFEKTHDNPGAKSYFVRAITPNVIIEQIDTSPKVREQLGIIRHRENDQEWQIVLQLHKAAIVTIKQTATYWLGITHYDTGRYETAIPWLKKRTLEVEGNDPWKSGARYNLSLTYEALGRLEEARKILLLDESPQKHGNLLRARYLRQRIEASEQSE